MFRAKLLAITVGMLATLAVTAVPAFAEFESTTSKGNVKVGTITIEGGGATLTCTSAEGGWTIFNGTVPSTKGKQEKLTFEKYAGCKVKTNLVTVTPTMYPCSLDLFQEAGKNKAIGAIVGSCKTEVKVLGTCTITATGSGLEENTLENVGANDVITANDSGITTKPSGSCIGIKETKEAKEKAVATAEGQKWL
ncbi:MAG: hypothetical protein ACHQDY_00155 [Solirubrobacterales bacterium]